MMEKKIPAAPVHHPLVAAQKIGLARALAESLIKAAYQIPGHSRKRRRKLLAACGLAPD